MEKYLDERLTLDERVDDLASKMTLEEKVSQLVNAASEIKRFNINKYDWWNEALHGVARAGTATVFPQAIALGAAWNKDLLFDVACAISDEARGKYNKAQAEKNYDQYYGLTFWSPNINIFRDPRWGRGQETYGEDPYLTSRLAEKFIKGMQGETEHLKTAACVKHFYAHSGPESGRFGFNSVVSKKDALETYLPAFEYCVKNANPETVMGAYNRVNGVPSCCNGEMLNGVLREKWGFKGHVVSDCGAVHEIYNSHHYTDTEPEAAAEAIKNGCDLNCGTAYEKLIDAYEEDLVTEEDIDRALKRVMKTRFKLGMFDSKTEYDSLSADAVCSKEHKSLCEKITRESLVLLKNDGILPLKRNSGKKIAIIGPNADSDEVLLGNYNGFPDEYINIKKGLENVYGDECIGYEKGSSILTGNEKELENAVRLAKKSDVVVLCLGLNSKIEGEQGDADGDRIKIELPDCQQKLLESVCDVCANVILVLLNGSALAVGYAREKCSAIIEAWYPGQCGGKAVAELLAGDYSPSGALPVTFYKSTDDLGDFCDYSMKNRTYKYFKQEPLYPFGFGLHYTTFELSGFEFDGKTASVCIKNTGDMPGGAIVQIYADSANEKDSPIFRLVAFEKTFLEKNESKTLKMPISDDAFVLISEQGEKYTPSSQFTLYAGTSLPTLLSRQLGADAYLSIKYKKI